MAFTIKDAETQRLAETLAEATGEPIDVATRRAIEERLARVGKAETRQTWLEELRAIRMRIAALPVIDPRSTEEILPYDEKGLPV